MSLLDRFPSRWRERLDSWEWWMGVAYFAIVAVIVGLFFLNNRTSKLAAQNAKAIAIRQAAAASDVQQCLSSIPLLARFRLHVKGVNDLAVILVRNSEAAIAAAPKNDPLAATRRANLARVVEAQRRIAATKTFPVPTRDQCLARGEK